jgi:hypothetical protein
MLNIWLGSFRTKFHDISMKKTIGCIKLKAYHNLFQRSWLMNPLNVLCIIESFRSHIVIQGSWVHVMAWAPSWPKLFHLSQPLKLQAQGNIMCRTSCTTNDAFSFNINEVLLTLHIFFH